MPTQVAGLLLPDVITFDTSNPNGFLNGRRLQDDVIDTVLATVSNGGVTTDMVGSNDVAFLGVVSVPGSVQTYFLNHRRSRY